MNARPIINSKPGFEVIFKLCSPQERLYKNPLTPRFTKSKPSKAGLILGGRTKERIRSFRRPGGSGVQRVRSDDGTPRGIRTPDLLLRRQLLYPAELLAHICCRTSRRITKWKPSEAVSTWEGGRRSRMCSFRGTYAIAEAERSELLPTLERVMGIEPTYPAWKAGVLPLNYTRTSSHSAMR